MQKKIGKVNNIHKIKIFSCLLIICLFSLSFLDAPEYVHCKHRGVCEFLEVLGELNNSKNRRSLYYKNYLTFGYKNLVYEKLTNLNINWIIRITFLWQNIIGSFFHSKSAQIAQIISISIILS